MGYLNLSSSHGASGTSFTNWENFENLLGKWKLMGANIEVHEQAFGRTLKVTATFLDGIIRWAAYTPSEIEITRLELEASKTI